MATATHTTPGSIILSGDLSSDGSYPTLVNTGVIQGNYSSIELYVDKKGRILEARSFTPDVDVTFPCATVDTCGVIKVGNNIAVDGASKISIPPASEDVAGVVKYGEGFIETDCGFGLEYTFPPATTSLLGGVQPLEPYFIFEGDELTVRKVLEGGGRVIQIDEAFTVEDKVLSVTTESLREHIPVATLSSTGLVSGGGEGVEIVTGNMYLDSSVAFPVLPIATTTTLGVIQIGEHFDVDGNIVALVPASDVQVGSILPSNNFTIDDGTLHFDVDASTTQMGRVQLSNDFHLEDGKTTIDPSKFEDATTTQRGVVQIGSSVNVDVNGLISIDKLATDSELGLVKLATGSGLTTQDGVLHVEMDDGLFANASHTIKGVFTLEHQQAVDPLTGGLVQAQAPRHTYNGGSDDSFDVNIVGYGLVNNTPMAPEVFWGQNTSSLGAQPNVKQPYGRYPLICNKTVRAADGSVSMVPGLTISSTPMPLPNGVFKFPTWSESEANEYVGGPIRRLMVGTSISGIWLSDTTLTRSNFPLGEFAPTPQEQETQCPVFANFNIDTSLGWDPVITIPTTWDEWTYQEPGSVYNFTYIFNTSRSTITLNILNTTTWKFPTNISRTLTGSQQIILSGFVRDNKVYVQTAQVT